MIVVVVEGNGRTRLTLEDSRNLGRGASGTVYSVTNSEYGSSVAKIYHDPAKFDRRKIEAMISTPPRRLMVHIDGEMYPQYAWPTHIIENRPGHGIGYLMPKVEPSRALTLEHFYDRTLLRDRGLTTLALPQKLGIARNLSAVLAELHRQGDLVIDFKPQNIKVVRETQITTLLDCDAYSISVAGAPPFPATNFTAEYIAPEALQRGLAPAELDESQDRFALAVLFFQLLNSGHHPFQGILINNTDLPTTDDKVREGFYPHGLTPHPGIRPRSRSIHDCFDDTTRAMFDRAFTRPPQQRPSAREWHAHWTSLLDREHGALQRCAFRPNNLFHVRFSSKPCGECRVEAFGASRLVAPAPRSPPVAQARPWGHPARRSLLNLDILEVVDLFRQQMNRSVSRIYWVLLLVAVTAGFWSAIPDTEGPAPLPAYRILWFGNNGSLRRTPGSTSSIIGYPRQCDSVIALERESGGWEMVQWGQQEGWVRTRFLDASPAPSCFLRP